MRRFMVDIHLYGIDDETRTRLLPREQEMIKEWAENGTLLASYIKQEVTGIYLVMTGDDAKNVDSTLSTLPYYPYMKIEITALRD